MFKIAVVIPTYNRRSNLLLTVTGLLNQSVLPEEIVIADDGSTDGTFDALLEAGFLEKEKPDIKYYRHKNRGYRVSLNRNQGTRLIGRDITHILYVDSDVVLNPEAIKVYYELADKYPECVVCGRYDWLPPMKVTPEDIIDRFNDLKEARLEMIPVESREKCSDIGDDPRNRTVKWTEEILNSFGVLSGNLMIPRTAFNKTGGFDENIEGRGQDGEFAHHLVADGFRGLMSERVVGYHLNHAMDREWAVRSVRETIKYIHQKYNIPLREEHLPTK